MQEGLHITRPRPPDAWLAANLPFEWTEVAPAEHHQKDDDEVSSEKERRRSGPKPARLAIVGQQRRGPRRGCEDREPAARAAPSENEVAGNAIRDGRYKVHHR